MRAYIPDTNRHLDGIANVRRSNRYIHSDREIRRRRNADRGIENHIRFVPISPNPDGVDILSVRRHAQLYLLVGLVRCGSRCFERLGAFEGQAAIHGARYEQGIANRLDRVFGNDLCAPRDNKYVGMANVLGFAAVETLGRAYQPGLDDIGGLRHSGRHVGRRRPIQATVVGHAQEELILVRSVLDVGILYVSGIYQVAVQNSPVCLGISEGID